MVEQNKVDPVENAVKNLELDIKGLMLLSSDSETNIEKSVKRLRDSHDDAIQDFLRRVAPAARRGALPIFVTAFGELVLAAFLLLLGVSIVAPVLLGYSTPSTLVDYFGQVESSVSGNPAGAAAIMLLNLLLSALLLFSAMYALRMASTEFKQLGLGPRETSK